MNNYKQTPLDSPPKKNFFLTVVYHICRQVAIATLHKFKIFCAIFHTPVKLLSIVSRVFVLIITIHYYSVLPCIWQISKKNTRPFVVFNFTCNSPAANSLTCILRKGSVFTESIHYSCKTVHPDFRTDAGSHCTPSLTKSLSTSAQNATSKSPSSRLISTSRTSET